MDTHQEKYQRAVARVSEIRKFHGKVVSYIIVMLLIIGYNYFINELRGTWHIWLAGFWGLGIAIRAFKLFGANLIFGSDWEKRMIEAEMKKEDNRQFYS